MSGGQLTVPLVLRTQGGAGYRGGAQHSQSLEAWLTHVPGLKVVMPSRPSDAAGLLASAIADPNPVVFIENKTLYFRTGDVPETVEPVPIGQAVTLREGRDVTIVALSRLVHDALEAADRLAAEDGIEAEVIDPRTLVPLDLAAIVASVERTGRLVDRPRGGRARRLRRRDRRAGRAWRPSTRSTRRSHAWARRSRRSRSARRSRTPICRVQTRSSRPCGRMLISDLGGGVPSGSLTSKGGAVYDYVIVGAGSAGCVLAGRLSEDPDVKVALLEAGGQDSRPEIAMPIAFPMLLKSSVDWDLYGEPEPGLGGRRLFLPRGKVLGGSGSINAMIYIRGNRADYDGWAAGGAEGWSYDEVLPYFKRSEDNERGEDTFHGVGGPLERVRQPRDEPADRDDARGQRARGPRLQPRLQRRSPGGRRPLPADAAQRAAPLDRSRVRAPGRAAPEPATSSPTRWRCASCSRARARSASRSPAAARSSRSAPSAR